MKTREEMLLHLPKNGKGAEIGVFEGTFSEIIIKTLTPSEFYLVDIFSGTGISGDKNGENMKTISLDESYNNLVKKYINNKNIFVVKGISDNFFNSIPDQYLDFIYIDGDHSYNGVTKDLNNSIKKVKKGGVVCGHDYHDNFIEVKNAVNDFCTSHNYKISLTIDDKLPSFYFIV